MGINPFLAQSILNSFNSIGQGIGQGFENRWRAQEKEKDRKQRQPLLDAQLQHYNNLNDKFLADNPDLIGGEGDIAKLGRLANQQASGALQQGNTTLPELPSLNPSNYQNSIDVTGAHLGDTQYTGPVGRQNTLGTPKGFSFGSIGDSGPGLTAEQSKKSLADISGKMLQGIAPTVDNNILKRAQENKITAAKALEATGAGRTAAGVALSPTIAGMGGLSEPNNQDVLNQAAKGEQQSKSDLNVKEHNRKAFGTSASILDRQKKLEEGKYWGAKLDNGDITEQDLPKGAVPIHNAPSKTAGNELERSIREKRKFLHSLELKSLTPGVDEDQIKALRDKTQQELNNLEGQRNPNQARVEPFSTPEFKTALNVFKQNIQAIHAGTDNGVGAKAFNTMRDAFLSDPEFIKRFNDPKNPHQLDEAVIATISKLAEQENAQEDATENGEE